jgi:hypothetical protein
MMGSAAQLCRAPRTPHRQCLSQPPVMSYVGSDGDVWVCGDGMTGAGGSRGGDDGGDDASTIAD